MISYVSLWQKQNIFPCRLTQIISAATRFQSAHPLSFSRIVGSPYTKIQPNSKQYEFQTRHLLLFHIETQSTHCNLQLVVVDLTLRVLATSSARRVAISQWLTNYKWVTKYSTIFQSLDGSQLCVADEIFSYFSFITSQLRMDTEKGN